MLFSWLITHQTASLEIRERFALSPAQCSEVQQKLLALDQVRSCLVLGTCNRTEIYLTTSDSTTLPTDEQIDAWMAVVFAADLTPLLPIRRVLQGEDAALHLMEVAAGLDSQILGDTEILGQIRTAWKDCKELAIPDTALQTLMHRVLLAARRVRSETTLTRGVLSLSSVAARQCQPVFGQTDKLKAMILGSGKTAHLTARHLQREGVKQFLIAGRNGEKVGEMARLLDGEPLTLDECTDHLWRADILVGTCTLSEPLLGPEEMRKSLQKRRYRPQLLLDMAVPRNIEPKVAEIEEVYLFNLEQLAVEIDETLARRQQQIPAVRAILEEEMKLYRQQANFATAAGLIRDFRHMGEKDADNTAQRLGEKLSQGKLDEGELAEQLRALSRRLMHLPTMLLREVGRHGLDDTRQRWNKWMPGDEGNLDGEPEPAASTESAGTEPVDQLEDDGKPDHD